MKSRSVKNDIDAFLNEITKGMGGLETIEYWPLNPIQILFYFDLDFLIDFYNRINFLKKKKFDEKYVASLFLNSMILTDFLINFACIGFKAADKLKLFKTEYKQRENFFNYIFSLIRFKDNNLFNEHGRLLYLNENDLKNISKRKFININESNRGIINRFKVSLFSLNWSFYYDVFAVYGSVSHGPYHFKYNGKKMMMVVDEYYNQKPSFIWPKGKLSSYERVSIYSLFEPFNYKLNIFGRAKISENIGKKLKYVLVEIDGKEIENIDRFSEIFKHNMTLSSSQYKYVENLTDLQKVDKAILMSYYVHRRLFGRNWIKYYKKTALNIKKFGNKFLKEKAKITIAINKKEILRRFDPRNNYY